MVDALGGKGVRRLLRKCNGGFRADWVEDEPFELWRKRNLIAHSERDKARNACRREAARRIMRETIEETK